MTRRGSPVVEIMEKEERVYLKFLNVDIPTKRATFRVCNPALFIIFTPEGELPVRCTGEGYEVEIPTKEFKVKPHKKRYPATFLSPEICQIIL